MSSLLSDSFIGISSDSDSSERERIQVKVRRCLSKKFGLGREHFVYHAAHLVEPEFR